MTKSHTPEGNGVLRHTAAGGNGAGPSARGRIPEHPLAIRPPGTPDLPGARTGRLDAAGEPESSRNIPDHFATALQHLISEIKEAEGNTIPLEGGRRVGMSNNLILYRFPLTKDIETTDDLRIEVMFGRRREQGSIISVGAGYLTVGLKADAGEELPKATLVNNSTRLLRTLQKRVVDAGSGRIRINRGLADATVRAGGIARKGLRPIPAVAGAALGPAQRSAYEHALKEPLTFIWGPPGCGKTLTLGEIVLSAFQGGKRILVCSNTNRAVDQVLWRICEGLGPEHWEMREGKILRLGTIDDDKLKQNYSIHITVDSIVNRKAKLLREKKRNIESEMQELKSLISITRQNLESFTIFGKVKRNFDEMEKRVRTVSADILRCSNQITRNLSEKRKLDREFERNRKARFRIFVRRDHIIWIDIQNNKRQYQSLHDRLATLQKECRFLHQSMNELSERRRRLEVFLENRNVAQENRILISCEDKLKKLVNKVAQIDDNIKKLRRMIVDQAKIVGATCTAINQPRNMTKPFDLVVIDEASMVLLPAVWLSAGQSRERVVISGDFRQIPSIVPSNRRTVREALGRDPFTATGRTTSDSSDLVMLDTQYRMHPVICALVAGPMYDGKLSTGRSRNPISDRAPPVPFETPLTIVDTSELHPFEDADAKRSRFNLLHAILTERLVTLLRREGVIASEHDLGIITPYAAQARLIETFIRTEDGTGPPVQVGTVHKFQGDERRLTIFEIPESLGGRPGLGVFLQGDPPSHTGARLINVAITRAQDHLIIIANLGHLDAHLPSDALLRRILHDMQRQGRIVPGRVLLKRATAGDGAAVKAGDRRPQGAAGSVDIFDAPGYEGALLRDILAAERSVKFRSRFPHPDRIAHLAEPLRSRLSAGVAFECTVRNPGIDGAPSSGTIIEAVSMLRNIGVPVGFGDRTDQSACLIDDRILWIGALDPLGRSGVSSAVMSRASNPALLRLLSPFTRAEGERGHGSSGGKGPRRADCGARTRARRGSGPTDIGTEPMPTEGYPACPKCGAPTRPKIGIYGPFLSCVRFPTCRGALNPPGWNAWEFPGESAPS